MFTAYRWPYIRLIGSVSPSEVPIRPASTVVLARDGSDGVEVLMVRRNLNAVFLGGARVFPGGAVDDVDCSDLARSVVRWGGDDLEFPWRAAALRELFEEAGILLGSSATIDPAVLGPDVYSALAELGEQLDADALTYFANWVTPLGPPRRFDARFYVVASTDDASTDDREVFDAEWATPAAALTRADRGDWELEFPTRKTLEWMVGHSTTADLVEAARNREVVRIAPRILAEPDGTYQVLLEGDHGFEDAPE